MSHKIHSPMNPYVTSGHVGGTPAFAGRISILAEILRRLNSKIEKGVIIYGQRGIGKTSLLWHLKANLSHKGAFLPILFDPSGISGRGVLLKKFVSHICSQLEITTPLSESVYDLRILKQKIFPAVLQKIPEMITPVFIIDEFDTPKFSRAKSPDLYFYSVLKDLADEFCPEIRFVMAIGRVPHDLTRIYDSFFRDMKLFHLPLLTSRETSWLIRLSEGNNTLKWPEAQVSAIKNLTGGHPFLTQILCQTVWNQIHEKGHKKTPLVQYINIGRGFSGAVSEAEPFFKWLWSGLGPWQRLFVSALSEKGGRGADKNAIEMRLKDTIKININSQMDSAARLLEKWGIIKSDDDGYAFRVNMISKWIMAHKPIEKVSEELDKMAENLFILAGDLWEKNDLKNAANLLHQCLALSYRHQKANELLAKVLIRLKRIDDAIKLLEDLIKQSNLPVFRSLLVNAFFIKAENEENIKKQFDIIEKILSLDPGNAKAKNRLRRHLIKTGDIAYENGDFEQALQAYEEAGATLKIQKTISVIDQIERQRDVCENIRGHRPLAWRILKKVFVICLFLSFFMGFGLFLLYGIYENICDNLPRINSLKDYKPPVITTVYSYDGKKIAEFYKERRIVVAFDKIPKILINAFIAAEDSRFYHHKGVDINGIIRAFFKNIEAGAVVQGGSTITQQVVKSFLLSPEKSYERKLKEAILAYRIDKAFSKDDILFLYLNQIYLGHGAYGVEAAAENYFGKSVEELDLAECAMMAGLCQAPSRDSPYTHFKRAKDRQKYVLTRMVEEGYISAKDARAAFNKKLDIHQRPNLFIEKVPYYTEHVRRLAEEICGREKLYTAGFKIYTAVDIKAQKRARIEMEKGLKALEKRHQYPKNLRPQGALLCMETHTGLVRAMLGGLDFTKNQFNRAIQAKRQPGSSFKPIIYAAAIDKGYSPATILLDAPFVIPDNKRLWKPSNYDHKFYGPISLRKAIAKSRNIPVIRTLRDIGIDYAIEYSRKLGIKSQLNNGLSLALGASGISLLEMVRAYNVFANRGKLVEPVFIVKISDRYGNEIPLEKKPPRQVIDPSTAFIMNSLLVSVVTNGTGYKAKKLGRPCAGKTGTTNDFRDAWFIGYTPDYITGTWVGFDIERSLGRSETGSKAACPVWLNFMKFLLKDKPAKEFPPPPDGVVFARIDAGTGLLAGPDSYNITYECFKKGSVPVRRAFREPVVIKKEDFFKSGL